MLNKSWSVLAACSVATVLAGCSGTGRFDRGQYAALASDPFLATDDVATSDGQPSTVITASATEHTSAAADQRSAIRPIPIKRMPTVSPAEVNGPPESSPFASGDLLASREAKETPGGGGGFDAWLQEQGSEVVQASAEFAEKVRPTANAVQMAVHEIDAPDFSKSERDDAPAPSAAPVFAGEPNPFAAEASAAPVDFASSESESPFQSAKQDSAWPPENFEFD